MCRANYSAIGDRTLHELHDMAERFAKNKERRKTEAGRYSDMRGQQ